MRQLHDTIPRGDIIIKYGEALNITCNLNMSMVAQYGENVSSRLYFTRNNEELPSEMIDVLNSTSIRLYLKDHPKGKQLNYYCWIRDEPTHKTALSTRHSGNKVVCFNVVFVGVAPQNITDFSCLSRNYENLTCSWTAKTNYVDTDYNLTYYLRVRASRNNKRHKRPDTNESKQTETRLSCYWDLYTDPQYRQSHGVFYFRLRMNNTFGTNENNFTFEHFKHVLPNPPRI
ncbi:hypothetical protein NQ318_003544 [Aromia moschata]|uniref:Uncharacterized protein n=1 Tax=Aromia moschata TaxID=1265417 RepID=A0AAV8YTW9_9CUCU|nr:hypothetical protein NQ318_003544 [Aromia moschata]